MYQLIRQLQDSLRQVSPKPEAAIPFPNPSPPPSPFHGGLAPLPPLFPHHDFSLLYRDQSEPGSPLSDPGRTDPGHNTWRALPIVGNLVREGLPLHPAAARSALPRLHMSLPPAAAVSPPAAPARPWLPLRLLPQHSLRPSLPIRAQAQTWLR